MPGFKYVSDFGFLLNPWFEIQKTFFARLFGYKYKTVLRYAKMHDDDNFWYATVHYRKIKYHKTIESAEKDLNLLSGGIS